MRTFGLILSLASLLAIPTGSPALTLGFETSAKPVARKAYRAMSEAERLEYVKTALATITVSLDRDRKAGIAVDSSGLRLVKAYVDRYADRVGTSATELGREDLARVFERASVRAPVIRHAFEAAEMPALLGIYVAMIESEYNECLTSSMGAKGIFQFLPSTGEKYGVPASDLCDLEKVAPAAARYLKDRRSEFGDSAFGTAVSILSYNMGTRAVKADLGPVLSSRSARDRDLALWATLSKPDPKRQSKNFAQEGSRYLPMFFAAAIVGENPRDFGIDMQPLSTY